MQKIMIIEDDEIIASSIKKHLEKWNYDVYIAADFENIMDDFRKYEPMLILLDISLPYYNGYYWCQEIRKESEVPIIFISSTNENIGKESPVSAKGLFSVIAFSSVPSA